MLLVLVPCFILTALAYHNDRPAMFTIGWVKIFTRDKWHLFYIQNNTIGRISNTVWNCDVNITTKKRLLNSYVFSVLKYGCERWTVNKSLMKRLHAFEHWCYRRMLKISWKDKVSNTDVLKRIKRKRTTTLQRNSTTETCIYAGHVSKGSGGRNALVWRHRAMDNAKRLWWS